MPQYYCECCNYETKIKTHFSKHLKTKKHNVNFKSQPFTNQNITNSQNNKPFTNRNITNNKPFTNRPKNNKPFTNRNITNIEKSYIPHEEDEKNEIKKYKCHHCPKVFTTKQAMYRHMKHRCKVSNENNMHELVDLLNQQIQIYDNDILKMKNHNDNLQKQINTLTKKLEIQTINNHHMNICFQQNNNAYQNNQINILNHGESNYNFLTDTDYIKCIKQCNHCVKTLIEKVHFNTEHPENMNIYVSSMKTNYLMIYKDKNWSIVDRKKHVDLLYELNEVQLENWYDECKNKYPEIIKSFNQYLYNKESSDVLNEVKKDIIRMLYNNKHLVLDMNNDSKDEIKDDKKHEENIDK